jgi:glycerophosphoryl diester phosphodiesterase
VQENTIEAFQLALKLGATGLESDVWLTADGVAVLDHDGVVKAGLRRRAIADVQRDALPSYVPALADLYDRCGHEFELSLDVKDAAAAETVVQVAREAGGADALGRLWLCHPDWKQVLRWRPLDRDLKLVDSTRIRRIKEGPERRAADLAAAGVDAVNMHASDWTGGLSALFHRFELFCFGWDAQVPRVLAELLGLGLDGVYSDHVDRMMDAIADVLR